MFYKDAKVYSDGSHYIAIPHTTNPTKRKRVVETPVEVPEEAQSISVSSTEPETQEIMSQEILLLLVIRCVVFFDISVQCFNGI